MSEIVRGEAAHVRSHGPTNLVAGAFGMLAGCLSLRESGKPSVRWKTGRETSSVGEQEERERGPENARPRREQQQSGDTRSRTEQRRLLLQAGGSSVGRSCYLPKKGRTLRRGCSSRPHTSRLRGDSEGGETGALSRCHAAATCCRECAAARQARHNTAKASDGLASFPELPQLGGSLPGALTVPAAASRFHQASAPPTCL